MLCYVMFTFTRMEMRRESEARKRFGARIKDRARTSWLPTFSPTSPRLDSKSMTEELNPQVSTVAPWSYSRSPVDLFFNVSYPRMYSLLLDGDRLEARWVWKWCLYDKQDVFPLRCAWLGGYWSVRIRASLYVWDFEREEDSKLLLRTGKRISLGFSSEMSVKLKVFM